MEVTAEGIETDEQSRLVGELAAMKAKDIFRPSRSHARNVQPSWHRSAHHGLAPNARVGRVMSLFASSDG